MVELFSIPDICYIRAGEVSQAKSKQGTLPIHYYVAMSGIEISWTRIKVLEKKNYKYRSKAYTTL